jgi:hypothetical protein
MSDQFTRREINRALLAGAFALVVPGVAGVKPRAPTPLFDFAIAGGWYHGLRHVGGQLRRGEQLVLRAEPGNSYDANAVAVDRADGLMLGYVPRLANAPVARLLAQGARIDAVIIESLRFRFIDDIPDDFAFTGFDNGDPRIRLTLIS